MFEIMIYESVRKDCCYVQFMKKGYTYIIDNVISAVQSRNPKGPIVTTIYPAKCQDYDDTITMTLYPMEPLKTVKTLEIIKPPKSTYSFLRVGYADFVKLSDDEFSALLNHPVIDYFNINTYHNFSDITPKDYSTLMDKSEISYLRLSTIHLCGKYCEQFIWTNFPGVTTPIYPISKKEFETLVTKKIQEIKCEVQIHPDMKLYQKLYEPDPSPMVVHYWVGDTSVGLEVKDHLILLHKNFYDLIKLLPEHMFNLNGEDWK